MKIYWSTFKKKWKKEKGKKFPVGSRIYIGHQGMGKTLSMVQDVIKLRDEFPNCLIYGNLKINIPNYYKIENDDDLKYALSVQNGDAGVAVVLDEAHLFFGKKTGIPLEVLTSISQQRKDRRKIFMTSQVWEELDISLRKQVKEIVKCRNFFGLLQFNRVQDGYSLHYDKLQSDYVADKLYTYIFKHNIQLYRCYDTYEKIINNSDLDIRYNKNRVVLADTSK